MSEIIIYEDADGQSAVQVRLDGETVWLTQKQMADLFESSEPLYKSREEKAAHLLYFVIKDHHFSDGNKRIGSFLFLLYLEILIC